jgi:hypothetical protein
MPAYQYVLSCRLRKNYRWTRSWKKILKRREEWGRTSGRTLHFFTNWNNTKLCNYIYRIETKKNSLITKVRQKNKNSKRRNVLRASACFMRAEELAILRNREGSWERSKSNRGLELTSASELPVLNCCRFLWSLLGTSHRRISPG